MAKIKMIICDGGVSRGFFDIRPQKECEYLIRRGHEVEVLLLYRDEDMDIPYRTRINNVDCVFLNCRGIITDWLAKGVFKDKNNRLYPLWFLIFVFKLKAYLNKDPADFLHTHNLYGTIAGVLAKSKKQRIIFDMREFYGMQGEKGIAAVLKKTITNYICRKAHKILYVHPLQKEEALPETQHKFLFLPNYPDTDYVFPIRKERMLDAPLFISYIGGIRERQKQYFEILARACAEAGGVKLAFHGGGNGYPTIEYLQEKYSDFVRVTGKYDGVKDTTKLFSECDLLYCCYDISVTNWQRAEPIKMFEAIATKTPFIISKGAYVASWVAEKDIGFVLDGGNYDEVLSFIQHIKKNREELKVKADNIERIMGQYTWNNVIRTLDEAFSAKLFTSMDI